MAITLIGEVVNSADSATGWSAGAISGDDDFVQGTGALGVKISAGTIALQTTALGAGEPYAFQSGGAQFGYHLIGWFNTKTPIAAVGGLRFFIGNSATNFVHYHVDPTVFYKGGFVTKVIDPARTADVAGGTFAVGSNPAQLTAINNVGMVFETITSIMGSFNNVQVDQLTLGLGVRADAGTVGVPNTFEIVRVQDENTSYWGWWSSTQGAFIGKGKLFIGPATGSAVSVFNDSAFSVIFANELVASGFYEFSMRGAGTDVTWSLASIAAARPNVARWGITVDATTNSFSDTNGVWTGADQLTLSANTTLVGTTMVNSTRLTQNGATLTGITVLSANTITGVGFLQSDNPSLITNSSFEFSAGHAITITTPGTYSFSGNRFSGYSGTGNSAPVYNNSGGAVTLNIAGGGDVPTIRNGTGATTVVNASVSLTVVANVTLVGAEIRIYDDDNTPAGSYGTEIEGVESHTLANYVYAGSSGNGIVVQVMKTGYEEFTQSVTMPSSDQTLNIILQADTNI